MRGLLSGGVLHILGGIEVFKLFLVEFVRLVKVLKHVLYLLALLQLVLVGDLVHGFRTANRLLLRLPIVVHVEQTVLVLTLLGRIL